MWTTHLRIVAMYLLASIATALQWHMVTVGGLPGFQTRPYHCGHYQGCSQTPQSFSPSGLMAVLHFPTSPNGVMAEGSFFKMMKKEKAKEHRRERPYLTSPTSASVSAFASNTHINKHKRTHTHTHSLPSEQIQGAGQLEGDSSEGTGGCERRTAMSADEPAPGAQERGTEQAERKWVRGWGKPAPSVHTTRWPGPEEPCSHHRTFWRASPSRDKFHRVLFYLLGRKVQRISRGEMDVVHACKVAAPVN